MRIINITTVEGINYWTDECAKLLVVKLECSEISKLKDGTGKEVVAYIKHQLVHELAVEGKLFSDRTVANDVGVLQMGSLIGSLCVSLQQAVGIDIRYCNTVPGHDVLIVIEYIDYTCAVHAIKTSIRIVLDVLAGKDLFLAREISKLSGMWQLEQPGQLSAAIANEATRCNIPFIELPNAVYQLGYGAKQRKFQRGSTDETSSMGTKLAGNKYLTNKILSDLLVPTPAGIVIDNPSELENAITKIGYPIVVKPLNGNNGRGVSVNIDNLPDATEAFALAEKVSASGSVLIEKFITGFDYRLLIVDYKFVAACKRTPAKISGDGIHTIQELIDIINEDPLRGIGHEKPLTKIVCDSVTLKILAEKKLTPQSIIPVNEELFLKKVANLSAGGVSEDVTEEIHTDNIHMAERIARIIGLDICGIDVISKNISVPFRSNEGIIIEVNSGPGLRLHTNPAIGKPRNAAGAIIDMLFKDADYFLPIIAISCNDEPSPLTNLVADLFMENGNKPGSVSKMGTRIQQLVISENADIPERRMILRDPTIDVAIIECHASLLLKKGSLFSYCTCALFIKPDFFSSDFPVVNPTTTVKLIAASLKADGWSIINIDDPLLAQTVDFIQSNIAVYSTKDQIRLKPSNTNLKMLTAFLANGNCVVVENEKTHLALQLAELPTYLQTEDGLSNIVFPLVLIASIHRIDHGKLLNILRLFKAHR